MTKYKVIEFDTPNAYGRIYTNAETKVDPEKPYPVVTVDVFRSRMETRLSDVLFFVKAIKDDDGVYVTDLIPYETPMEKFTGCHLVAVAIGHLDETETGIKVCGAELVKFVMVNYAEYEKEPIA